MFLVSLADGVQELIRDEPELGLDAQEDLKQGIVKYGNCFARCKS
jgi:hypothetical protein